MAANAKMAPAELILEAGVHPFLRGAFAVSPTLGILIADGVTGSRLSSPLLFALARTALVVDRPFRNPNPAAVRDVPHPRRLHTDQRSGAIRCLVQDQHQRLESEQRLLLPVLLHGVAHHQCPFLSRFADPVRSATASSERGGRSSRAIF